MKSDDLLNLNSTTHLLSIMSKYVPRFMKASEIPKGDEPTTTQEPRRWGAELKPVVNTSLPAKFAPKLVPVTLATATTSAAPLAPICIKNRPSAPSMEDFPSLGGARPRSVAIAPKMSFAEMSRNWADKQKEDEAAAKQLEEDKRMMEQAELRLQERAAREAQELRKLTVSSYKKKVDSDEEKYLEEEKSSTSEEPYISDEPMEEVLDDDEEEEYVNDGSWNSRKHRDELY